MTDKKYPVAVTGKSVTGIVRVPLPDDPRRRDLLVETLKSERAKHMRSLEAKLIAPDRLDDYVVDMVCEAEEQAKVIKEFFDLKTVDPVEMIKLFLPMARASLMRKVQFVRPEYQERYTKMGTELMDTLEENPTLQVFVALDTSMEERIMETFPELKD